MNAPNILRTVALCTSGAPAIAALFGMALQRLIPDCDPQMYGASTCEVGGFDLSQAIVLMIEVGLPTAWLSLMAVTVPLYVVAWWIVRTQKAMRTVQGPMEAGFVDLAWHHEQANEPIRLVSSVDPERREVRKLTFFRDGSVGCATRTRPSDQARLSEAPVPAVSEINQDSQFSAAEISAAEFELLWDTHARACT